MAAMQAIEGIRRTAPMLVDIDDSRAWEAALVGTKAATLACARAAGFPVLPGYVATTATWGGAALDDPGLRAQLQRCWRDLTADGTRPIVVRSSSIAEDGVESSMAGMFRSVTNVASWDVFMASVATASTHLRAR